ncbi:translation initiation factor IF-2-like [Leptopilina heterotoma]|uniref:translation initiation factor IF-2-like n=2 Tax=Leptopilina heterotoma TaxID=63436 RepID=UPI001CA9DC66|nr:translation initiation factor IF-2-like isoform X3 [Leptopilina heterotoma]XP_043470577.1 translation initiation factor IF-2-like isoform X3 [Leptopilina heterotoma]XP_043470578.1 translation initiation factor IF-2-like isoform X3 [Leptopilina heterotoma]XP_043479891.1 translation initiation factor IF-2-like [Leptopilina heterotoma]
MSSTDQNVSPKPTTSTLPPESQRTDEVKRIRHGRGRSGGNSKIARAAAFKIVNDGNDPNKKEGTRRENRNRKGDKDKEQKRDSRSRSRGSTKERERNGRKNEEERKETGDGEGRRKGRKKGKKLNFNRGNGRPYIGKKVIMINPRGTFNL